MADNILEIRHLSKSFGTHEVLRDIDFTVSKGDVISIIGASGSGKSTLLRCINLLETPSSGEILYHGENVTGKSVNAAKYRSHVGMVFQSFNLFNNMTVLKNCMVGQMKVLGRSKAEAQEQAMRYLEKVGMAPYVNAKPRQLSGGQKRKVALAKGLAQDFDVLLLDEPTSGLDPVSREELLEIFLRLGEEGVAILFSTHITSDLEKCADDITYIQKGEILATGPIGEFQQSYRLIRRQGGLTAEQQAAVLGRCREKAGDTLLIRRERTPLFEGLPVEEPTLEEIMVHLEKEGEA